MNQSGPEKLLQIMEEFFAMQELVNDSLVEFAVDLNRYAHHLPPGTIKTFHAVLPIAVSPDEFLQWEGVDAVRGSCKNFGYEIADIHVADDGKKLRPRSIRKMTGYDIREDVKKI